MNIENIQLKFLLSSVCAKKIKFRVQSDIALLVPILQL